MYMLMEATGWKFLPASGGLSDQDEMLMENILSIASRVNQLRRD